MAVSVLLKIETYRGGRRGSWTWAKEKNKMGLSGESGPRKKSRSGHGPNRLRT